MIVGIDASRAKSGGAKAHLVGILDHLNPEDHGIKRVHVWAYKALAECLPEKSWLTLHHSPVFEGPMIAKLAWQFYTLPRLLRDLRCSIVLNVDAGTFCPFKPCVTISQDMLSFERGEMSRFWPSLAWLRLFVLRYVQINSLARSTGVIFLTQYAASTISSYLPVSPKNLEIIPHGINDAFRAVHPKFFSKGALTKVVYVSNVSEYKHQWHLVEAIHRLRMDGYELKLELIGGGKGRAQRRLENILKRFDPNGDFVRVFDFLPHEELLKVVATADIFVFASSCENLPITLLEGMALGLPIVCSDRGPMKEVLGNGGQYFDPEDIEAICRGLRSVLDTDQREKQLIAHERSKTFTWSDCSFRTFSYLRKVLATL